MTCLARVPAHRIEGSGAHPPKADGHHFGVSSSRGNQVLPESLKRCCCRSENANLAYHFPSTKQKEPANVAVVPGGTLWYAMSGSHSYTSQSPTSGQSGSFGITTESPAFAGRPSGQAAVDFSSE